jgi:glycosyltransferase involved in cell wall biosynthesis
MGPKTLSRRIDDYFLQSRRTKDREMSPSPYVSIVVPCYNASRFICETLRSAISQTHAPLEIIVVDDGSVDNSASLAESFGPPVRVVRQANQSQACARNRGIGEARGEWIAFLDADDVWLPAKLERQLSVAANSNGAVCCATYVTSVIPVDAGATVWRPTPTSLTVAAFLRRSAPFQMSTLMVHRSMKVRFADWTRTSEDNIYMLDLLHEHPIAICDEPLSVYRIHSQSYCRSTPDLDCRAHTALSRWLDNRQIVLGDRATADYRRIISDMLLNAAKSAVYKRDWRRLKMIQDYSRRRMDVNDMREIVQMPSFPRFLYGMKDGLCSLVGQFGQNRRRKAS